MGQRIQNLSRRKLLLMAVVIVVICLIPAIWLFTLKVAGVRLITAQDPFGFMAMLAAVAGAIFTAAGLVTALAAVVTLLSVNESVKREFNRELPRLLKEADQQIDANITFLQAKSTGDWKEQVRLGRKAIDQYRGLSPKVHAYLAQLLANRVIQDFAKQHTRLAVNYTSLQRWNPTPDAALEHIWEAQSSRDDPDGELAALNALMYGAANEFDSMIHAIQRGRLANPRMLMHLLPAPRLAILAYACGSDRARLQQLGKVLDHPLPVKSAEVLASINQVDLSENPAGPSPCAEWIVVGKRGQWSPSEFDKFPATARILLTTTNSGDRQCQLVLVPGQVIAGHDDIFVSSDLRNPDEAASILDGLFLFICEDTTYLAYPIPFEPAVVMG